MRTFRSKFLTQSINLVLILSVLNLFQACATYHIAKKNPKNEQRLANYQTKGRYLILKNKDKAYHLSNIKIMNGAVTGFISEVPQEHLANIFPAGEQPKKLNQERSAIIDSEVILYINLEIPENDTTVTIALGSIDEISFYKWRKSTGAIVGLTVGCVLGGGILILLVAAGLSINQNGIL
jgi:hypothetical protein